MDELTAKQAQLQREADEVVRQLHLEELLAEIGEPIRVGSSAMGLMVRRDIDITVVCPKLDSATIHAVSDLGARLLRDSTMVASVNIRNECGAFNQEPDKYPDGLYLGLFVHASNGARWTLDIWVIDEPERQPDLKHLRELLPRITHGHRDTILDIKARLLDRKSVSDPPARSVDVYEAVLNDHVYSVEQFDLWQLNRVK